MSDSGFCYPCSVHGHACVQEEAYVPPIRPVPVRCPDGRSGGRWFDVALWRRFPSLWPEWTGLLQADDAFSAVVQLMHAAGLASVDHAAAIALDGSIVYRAYGVRGVTCGLIWFAGRRNADSAASAAGESEKKRSVSS
jgi:hypothetical protein